MATPLLTLASEAPTSRRHRKPKHKFQIEVRPYQIVPFMIAPVLPGETMNNALFEAREVSKPIKNSVTGWSSEFYWFYVRIRDLNDRDTLDDLFTNPLASVSSLNAAASVPYYHAGGSPNYSKLCLQRVTETWFRDPGETWNANDIGNYPGAQMRDQGWMDSLVDTTVLSDGTSLGTVSAGMTPEALDALLDNYEQLRAMNMVSMDFEDYLRTFGIKTTKSENHEPELLFSVKNWTYPVNTVEPTTGVPSAAVSWVHKKAHSTRKFFREPGFIFGVHIVRPKVYFSKQVGALAHFLDRGLSWLPAIMRDSPETSLREFTGGAGGVGPLGTNPTNGYWVDMRDLFLYGDQYVNFALSEADNALVALPTAALNRKYLSSADVDGLFAAASPANTLLADGYTSLDISGTQADMTPTSHAA